MNLPLFIARRVSGSRSQTTTSSRVMVRIAIISISLSIAVMVIALSIVEGFKKELTDKVTGFASDLQITLRSTQNHRMLTPFPADTIDFSAIRGVERAAPYASANGLLQTENGVEGVVMKGYDERYDWSFIEKHLTEGQIPQYSDSTRSREAVISSTLARKMGLDVGDIFKFIVINENPRRDRFRVAAIFNSGIEEFDSRMIIADISTVARINGWRDGVVEGIQIRTDGTEEAADLIFQELPMGLWSLDTAGEMYGQFFDWINMMELNTIFVLVIMMVVAAINMLGGVLVIVLESVKMVGVLKTQGMSTRSLQLIFLYRSSYIVLWGMLWGNLAAAALLGVQYYFGLLRLDATAYLLSVVPVWISPVNIIILNAAAFIVITLLMILPTMIIERISPAESVKYE